MIPLVCVSFIYKTKLFFTVTNRVGHFAFEYLWVYCLIPNKIMLGIRLLQYYIICKIYYLMEICCSYIFMTTALNLASGSKEKRQKHLLIWSADKIMLIFLEKQFFLMIWPADKLINISADLLIKAKKIFFMPADQLIRTVTVHVLIRGKGQQLLSGSGSSKNYNT